MLEKFNSKSSFEKRQITADDNSWSDFCSLFEDSNQYDPNDLRHLLKIHHKSTLNGTVLLDTVDLAADSNQLQISILNTLFNANRIKNMI